MFKFLGLFGFSLMHGFSLFGVAEAIGIGASVVGGMMQKDAADDAAKKVGRASALNQRQIKEQQKLNDAAFSPYRSTGTQANNRLSYLLGLGSDGGGYVGGDKYTIQDFIDYNARIAPAGYGKKHQLNDAQIQYNQYMSGDLAGDDLRDRNNFRALYQGEWQEGNQDGQYGSLLDPFSQQDLESDVVYNTGLQFGLDEGEKAINRLASARGGIDSGSTLKALTRYANDYGSTKAEGAYNRFNTDKSNIYGFLSGQQGVGLNATSNNMGLNNQLLTGGMNANSAAAGQQAQYGYQGATAFNQGIQGGVGNYLYGQRVNQPSQTYGNSTVPWYLS